MIILGSSLAFVLMATNLPFGSLIHERELFEELRPTFEAAGLRLEPSNKAVTVKRTVDHDWYVSRIVGHSWASIQVKCWAPWRKRKPVRRQNPYAKSARVRVQTLSFKTKRDVYFCDLRADFLLLALQPEEHSQPELYWFDLKHGCKMKGDLELRGMLETRSLQRTPHNFKRDFAKWCKTPGNELTGATLAAAIKDDFEARGGDW